MGNVLERSLMSSQVAYSGNPQQDCPSTCSKEQEGAQFDAQRAIMCLPKNLLSAVAPKSSKLALLSTCKAFKDYLLDNHGGLMVKAPPVGDGDAREDFMGPEHIERLRVCLEGLDIALQHAGSDLVTLKLTGHNFNQILPALDNAALRELVQGYNYTKLQRVSIAGFRVPDLVPLSVFGMFPNLTHLHLDDFILGEQCCTDITWPVSTPCKLQHLGIGTYRIFSPELRAAWSSLTTSYAAPDTTTSTTSHLLHSVTSLTAITLHGSFASFIDPSNIKRLTLNGDAQRPLSVFIPGSDKLAAALLQPYTRVTHFSAASLEFTAESVPILMSMYQLQHAELNISTCDLQADFSNHKWQVETLILNTDIIKPTTVHTLQRLPLRFTKTVIVKRFQAVALPDSLAGEFSALASRIKWVRQAHEVSVSVGTAAAAAIVPYMDVINMTCALSQEFLLALASVAQSRRLTLSTLWHKPTAQQLAVLPVLCKNGSTRYVLGMKPILLHNPLPPIHNLTAQTIVGEVLDIVLRLTQSSAGSAARLQLQHRLANNTNPARLQLLSMKVLQAKFRSWMEGGGSLQEVVQVLNQEFDVVSLIA